MSDPIEKLTRLGDALEGAPMPLPASEIRARGDRIRRRRHAVVAGAGAAVVAAVAVPVVALTVGDDDRPDPIAPQPTISDPVRPGPIGPANLLTSDEAIYPNGGSDWRESATFEGDGQATASPCQRTSLAGLGADAVLQRDFEFVVTDTGAVEPSLSFNEVIAEFPSAAEAEAAYAEIRGWYDDCLPPGADTYDAGEFAPVAVGVDGSAEVQLSTYRPVDEELDPSGDEGWLLETGLVLSGDRIAVLTQLTHGQDYDWPDGTPVEQMLPAAAERLVLGNGGGEPGERDGASGGAVTDLPDGFPLTDGWPADDGSDEYQLDPPSIDNPAMATASDLEGCGQGVDPGDAADRLTARLDLGSAYYGRELQLFATEEDAASYWDSIQDSFSVCEADGGPGYTVEQSGETVALLWSEAIHRSVTIAVRDRNAVLVSVESDEGGTDLDTIERMWVGVAESQSAVLDELARLLDGDQGGGTVDTRIPDGIPLDADLDDPGADGEIHRSYRPDAAETGVELDVCGRRVWPATGTADRMWSWASGPEHGDRRELVTFASVDEAVAAVEAIRVAVRGCQQEGTVVWTVSNVDTGYDSVTFHRTYTQGLGHDAIQVTRVGAAVLLVHSYGEGSVADIGPTDEERTALTMTIAPSMCVFTEDGCL